MASRERWCADSCLQAQPHSIGLRTPHGAAHAVFFAGVPYYVNPCFGKGQWRLHPLRRWSQQFPPLGVATSERFDITANTTRAGRLWCVHVPVTFW